MSAALTPGPWTIDNTRKGFGIVEPATGYLVADVVTANPEDARLIAAAPDMVKALCNALRALNTVDCPLSSMQMAVVADIERILAKVGL